jgi:DNA-binding transcriptional LysR family regulator
MTPAIGVATGMAAAKAAAEYYLERQVGEATQRTAAYYAQNETAAADAIAAGQGCAVMPRADMAPDVAAALALDPTKPVGVGQLTNLLAGLRADGAEIEGSQRGVRAYKHPFQGL